MIELHSIPCFIFLGTFVSCFHLYQCKILEDYSFPVYSTEFCPRNQIEWNKRSSAINCNGTNAYMCVTNENLTQLLEFCYSRGPLVIPEGYCLYLRERIFIINTYSCSHFINGGCPTTYYRTSKNFE